MPIATSCTCGAEFKAPEKVAGKRVKCPKCQQPVTVPGGEAGKAKASGKSTIPITCSCGKTLAVPAKFAGKKIACPACQTKLAVKPKSKAVTAPADDPDDMGNLLDEVDLSSSQTGQRCPNCRADLDIDDVLCIACGFNLEKGKQVKTKTVNKVSQFVDTQKTKSAAPVDAPKAVESLAKVLNALGTIAVLAAVGFVIYSVYSAVKGGAELDVDTVIGVMKGSAGMVTGVAIVLFAVPCSVAATQVLAGKSIGRILSIVVSIVGLLGIITTLPAILALKLAFADEVAQFCKS